MIRTLGTTIRRIFLLTLALTLTASRGEAGDSTVLFHGGAGHVGGSCAEVEKDGYRVLVDCGTQYGEESKRKGRRGETGRFGFDPRSIDHVVVTHAHEDHAGRLPEFVRAGFSGTIWMTPPTLSILSVTWRNRAKYEKAKRYWTWTESGKKRRRTLHWRSECVWSRKIAADHRRTYTGTFGEAQRHIHGTGATNATVLTCGECDRLELDDTLQHVRTVAYGQSFSLGPFSVVLRSVKHLPGSASVTFGDGNATWTFSGDLGTKRSRLVGRIDPAEKVDAVFVEATSGDSGFDTFEDVEKDRLRFRQTVGTRVKDGGLAWIPAFALDRSQRVLLEVQVGMDEGLIPTNAPVYFLSPSSREIAKEYATHPEWLDNAEISRIGVLLDRAKKRFSAADYKGGGGILLSTSGMMDMGASFAMLPALVPRRDVTICLVGYQSPGTPGGRLKRGAKSLTVAGGRKIGVGCRVESFGCFSDHAEGREVDEWLANNWQSKIYLVHGDADALAKRKAGLEKRHNADVEVAKTGVKYVLGAKK